MSLALHPLDIVNTYEPRTKIYNQRKYAILRGGQESTWKPCISTSYSDSTIQFSAPPPNPKIMVDRKVMTRFQYLVTLSGDAGSGKLLFQPGTSAPRNRPNQRIVTTLNVTLNNTAVSINSSDIIDIFLHYYEGPVKREIHDSMSPSMLDQAQEYSDVAGGIRDPLRPYASSVSGADITRGAFDFEVLSNTQTTATILLTCTDYLYLPPFKSDENEATAFIQLQTMDFNFTLGDLSRVWSVNTDTSFGGVNITNVTATLAPSSGVDAPRLLFNYITPDPLIEIPKSVPYPYYEIQRYPTIVPNMTAGSSTFVVSSNIQLHSIPNRFYIFAREQNADQSWSTSDVFLGIDSVSINWDNRNGLLSSATPQDLYKMSVANGLNISWPQFSTYVGSPLCIVMGKDIGLQANQCPGMLGTFQLQMNVNLTNLNSSRAITPVLYIVTVSEGIITLEDNRAITQIGVVSERDVLDTLNAPEVPYIPLNSINGASFFSSIGDFFKDLPKNVYNAGKSVYEHVAPVFQTAMPYIQKGIEIGKNIKSLAGYGMSGGKRVGRPPGTKKKKGGVLYEGGAMMSRSEMARRNYM